MKQVVIILVALLFVLPAKAQGIFDELVEMYSEVEGFSAVQLTSDMFELYLKKKNIAEDDPVYEVLNELENMSVVSQTMNTEDEELMDEIKMMIRSHYEENDYSLFKTDKQANSDLKIYINKENDDITSMGLLSSNSISVNLIEMNGIIDLANIASLSRAMNIRGLEQLRVFDNRQAPDNFFFNYEFAMPDMSHFQLSEEERKEIEKHVGEARKEFEKHRADFIEHQKELGEYQKDFYKKYKKYPLIISGSDSKNAEYFINDEKVDVEDFHNVDPDEIESIEVTRKEEGKERNAQVKIYLKNR